MNITDSNITNILLWMTSGLIASGIMGAFVVAFRHYNLVPANAIRAIGRSFTHSEDSALRVGWEAHLFMGMVFALIYRQAALLFNITSPIMVVGTCGMLGFMHGIVVSFLLVISVGEYSEISRYREQGIVMASLYWAAHVLYGITLGAFVLGLRYSFS